MTGSDIASPTLVEVAPRRQARAAWLPSAPSRLGLGALGIVLFLTLWQLANAFKVVDPVLLPPLQTIFRTFVANWLEPTLSASVYTTEIAATLGRMALGFATAAALGVGLGLLIGSSEWLAETLQLTLTLARYLPPAILVPVLLLFSGKSETTVLAVIVFGAFWPILLNTVDGVRSVDPMLLDTVRLYRYRSVDVAARIVLPMALPQIVVGLRLAVSVCLLSAVVGEMLGGTDGLGYAILIAQRTFSYPDMYGGIVLLGTTGVAINGLFRILERRLLHWHPIGRSAEIA
jgi:ABC-type nitrate/sulfonate/bicarbonate transport system permease component